MTPQTYIIIGRSGAGKGTQSDLLQEYIKEQDSNADILYVESGDEFREFLKRDTYASTLAQNINIEGKLQPAFLAIWVWAKSLIENLDDKKFLIIDGTPRKINEAHVLDEAFSFYGRKNTNVIFINVSDKWAGDRLKERKRSDDTAEGIEKRLNWFDEETMPAVEFYKNNSQYNFLEINGEQTVEEVHNEIVKNLENKNG